MFPVTFSVTSGGRGNTRQRGSRCASCSTNRLGATRRSTWRPVTPTRPPDESKSSATFARHHDFHGDVSGRCLRAISQRDFSRRFPEAIPTEMPWWAETLAESTSARPRWPASPTLTDNAARVVMTRRVHSGPSPPSGARRLLETDFSGPPGSDLIAQMIAIDPSEGFFWLRLASTHFD